MADYSAGMTAAGAGKITLKFSVLLLFSALFLVASIVGASTAVAIPMVTGADVVDDSLSGVDIQEFSLASVPNANLAHGLDAVERVRNEPVLSFAPNGVAGTVVFCPPNHWATGGGGSADAALLDLVATVPYPVSPYGWQVVWRNRTANPLELQVSLDVLCVRSS